MIWFLVYCESRFSFLSRYVEIFCLTPQTMHSSFFRSASSCIYFKFRTLTILALMKCLSSGLIFYSLSCLIISKASRMQTIFSGVSLIRYFPLFRLFYFCFLRIYFCRFLSRSLMPAYSSCSLVMFLISQSKSTSDSELSSSERLDCSQMHSCSRNSGLGLSITEDLRRSMAKLGALRCLLNL